MKDNSDYMRDAKTGYLNIPEEGLSLDGY